MYHSHQAKERCAIGINMIIHTFLAMLVDLKKMSARLYQDNFGRNTKVCETLFRCVSFDVYKMQQLKNHLNK